MRVDLDENTLCGVNVDLQESRFVERRIEKGQEALENEVKELKTSPKRDKNTWCVISGRASAMSRPVFAKMPWWSSQFSSAYLTSPSRPFLFLPPVLTRYASRQACSRITKSRRWLDAGPLFGTWACTGSMWGLAGAGMGFLDGTFIALRGRGRVGRSAGATAASGDVGVEEREELEAFSSICIPSFSSSSYACCSSSSPSGRRRCCGRSWAGVDFGLGGACESTARALSEGKAMGLTMSPERD